MNTSESKYDFNNLSPSSPECSAIGNDTTNETSSNKQQNNTTTGSSFYLDNIIVGYAFGPKKMETMGLIMAEASKALSTFDPSCCGNTDYLTTTNPSPSTLVGIGSSSLGSKCFTDDEIEEEDTRSFDERSLSSTYTRRGGSSLSGGFGANNSNNNKNGIQLTFLPDSNGMHLVRSNSVEGNSVGEGTAISEATTAATSFRSKQQQLGGGSGLSTMSSSPSSTSFPPNPLACLEKQHQQQNQQSRRNHCGGYNSDRRQKRQQQNNPIRVSFVPIDLDIPLSEQHGGKFDVILHKLTEDILCLSKMLRHDSREGGFEEEWLLEGKCVPMNKKLEFEQTATATPQPSATITNMTKHQIRASNRIQQLRHYKQNVHPSCVLVDSPVNILAVMSRADMASVLSRCLVGVTTKGYGLSVRTPRFRVVDEAMTMPTLTTTLADEIDSSGFHYPLIAKPLTAAGTKSSHHMGIVLARDGLQRLKLPCLLQEYANHGEKLFKVYILGDSVWVFSRDSLPNLPGREIFEQFQSSRDEEEEDDCQSPAAVAAVAAAIRPQCSSLLSKKRPRTESYVEFERPAGSRCYVEFNSQRPYPKLSDFGLTSSRDLLANNYDDEEPSTSHDDSIKHEGSGMSEEEQRKKQRCEDKSLVTSRRAFYSVGEHCQESSTPLMRKVQNNTTITATKRRTDSDDLARFVTKDELEPVTTALRNAFGLELFGFDVLVKHNNSTNPRRKKKNNPALVLDGSDDSINNDGDRAFVNDDDDVNDGKEILVVDVNYFPGYKEVPNFPSLLAQYLTQKAVESRANMR